MVDYQIIVAILVLAMQSAIELLFFAFFIFLKPIAQQHIRSPVKRMLVSATV